ncbi:High mobility group box protein with ARID/BRIGHT DNA-binding domain [Prunus dulcis]|uniref:High mobility group box protein with ARID/BRIGHT DNA-binding domain n=1 Tax=Prunus dulcis TaxID=3755 RepID=A0A4Y1RJR8_PRUDU|nr:high mobility group B protein 10-like isoform X1 [Prunus dulcis]BBH04469.1 High mobility group box protein with ARID/BRIGHT DNA-binding domain [Prunus dulcis]VVA18866.1 PREDICTED: high mobility group [Prunus dulcis]
MSEAPTTPITEKEPSTAISAQQQQVRTETANGSSSSSLTSTTKVYPPATAKYEEVVQSSDLFWEKLKEFHDSFRTKFVIPTVGGKALDLHLLFVEVTSRGGLEKVIRDRKWKEVIVVFNFPTTITSASFVLRKYYSSLLYHFEQAYYFHKEVFSIPVLEPLSRNLLNGSATLEEGASRNQFPGQESSEVQLGCSIMGSIDGKFDHGYLVSVNLGSDELKGVLYHAPTYVSQSFSDMPTRRNRKRSRLALRDPSRPKSNRSGYNFFFAEHYARLKPLYYGQERAISKKIGFLWNNLTEAEKQVYQEKGMQDKERYRTEMLEYKSSGNLTQQ